jgi:hypothetical protein
LYQDDGSGSVGKPYEKVLSGAAKRFKRFKRFLRNSHGAQELSARMR